MEPLTYFLVNDTRYDNHHGCLQVVRNLHKGMKKRGWTCVGSLPVSTTPHTLKRYRSHLARAQRVIVNGEGSLHHNNRNTERTRQICDLLLGSHSIALINTIWQDNDADRWAPLLKRFAAIYTRDQRSQMQLQNIGISAGYAPDLTFYDYPTFTPSLGARYACTDSVLNSWTRTALRLCEQSDDIDFLTLFTGKLHHMRHPRDWDKYLKYGIYPKLWKSLGIPVPIRYQALPHAIEDTDAFLKHFASSKAACIGRYHALCFALQQNIPFVAIASNSHKSEALLEEVGLPADVYMMDSEDVLHVRDRLDRAIANHAAATDAIKRFNQNAKTQIDVMFDDIANIAP